MSFEKNKIFNLGKNTPSKMYITFVRPILEYASFVLDGCSQYEIEKLLRRFSYMLSTLVQIYQLLLLKTSLNCETVWETFFDTRRMSKLTIMYKIHNNYLSRILPNARSHKLGTLKITVYLSLE